MLDYFFKKADKVEIEYSNFNNFEIDSEKYIGKYFNYLQKLIIKSVRKKLEQD